MNPVANSYNFTTDTAIKQTLTPLALTASAPTLLKSWIAKTTTHTTGTVVAPTLASGTISMQEQIKQTLSPVSSTASVAAWTIDAEFDAVGSFQLKPSPTAMLSPQTGLLTLKGELKGSISPPPGTEILTQKIDNLVTAEVVIGPIWRQRSWTLIRRPLPRALALPEVRPTAEVLCRFLALHDISRISGTGFNLPLRGRDRA